MDQAQAAQVAFTKRVVAQVGDDQPFFVTNNDVLNNAGTADEDADLAADVAGKFDQPGGQFMAAELCLWDAPAVEALQGLDLT